MPIVLFTGIIFFLVYRVIIGEWLLYPIRHGLHAVLDWAWRQRKPADFISFTRLLASIGANVGSRRQVYSAIRDFEGVLEPAQRNQLDFLHATYHLFYIAALELFVAGAYLWSKNAADWLAPIIIGSIFLLFVFVADIKQDIWECRLLRRRDRELRDFVRGLGFDVSPGASAGALSNHDIQLTAPGGAAADAEH